MEKINLKCNCGYENIIEIMDIENKENVLYKTCSVPCPKCNESHALKWKTIDKVKDDD